MKLLYTSLRRQLLRFAVICLLLTIGGSAIQAQSIITNGDFEIFNQCPTNVTQTNRATDWFQPTGGTSDYYNNLCTFGTSKISTTVSYLPQSGNGCAGFYTESYGGTSVASDYKEYISQQLASPMVAGRTYTVSFYMLSTLSGGVFTSVNLPPAYRGFVGACFSASAPNVSNTSTPTTGSPAGSSSITGSFAPTGRVYVNASNPVYTNNQWTLISLTYTATGGEQFITIGNFRPGVAPAEFGPFVNNYFIVDNFSLVASCNAGTAQVGLNGGSLSNVCPLTTVNLNSLFTGTAPAGSGLVWYNNNAHTGTAISDPAHVGAGTYYAFFYDGTNNCFNTAASTASVLVSITAPCCNAGTAQVGLIASSLSNTCPATTVNLNSLFTGTLPTGTSLVWFTNNAHSGTAYATPTTAGAGTYYAFFYDATNNCYNTAASTASVLVSITAPCCNAGTAQVGLIASSLANSCPATTVNLNSLFTGTLPTGTSLVWFTNNAHSGTAYATPTTAGAGTYYAFFYDATNNCYNTGASAALVVVSISTCTTSTIVCSKTTLIKAPVAGTPSQLDLVITINVTAPGCFSPISVSGSGMSLANGITQVCATTTGLQEFHIPLNYSGAALGIMNFSIGSAGSCSADLTKPPKTKIIEVWTLDNCTLVNVAPVLK